MLVGEFASQHVHHEGGDRMLHAMSASHGESESSGVRCARARDGAPTRMARNSDDDARFRAAHSRSQS
jgi:hypothetical protein